VANDRRPDLTKLVTGTNYCECTACGIVFGGVGVFDAHRVFAEKNDKGKYIEDWDKRRCLTIAEMVAKGWRQDTNGYWGRAYGRKAESAA
jgi:hypothetical protein